MLMKSHFSRVLWSFLTLLSLGILIFSPISNSEPSLDSEGVEFLTLINDYRIESDECWNGAVWRAWAGHEARELTESNSLSLAAENHNLYMIEQQCVDHQCEGEAPLPERVTAAGYPSGWTQLRENLGAGQTLERAQSVFNGWRNSPSHNEAMRSCKMQSIGIARNYSENSEYGWYWTADFGDLVE